MTARCIFCVIAIFSIVIASAQPKTNGKQNQSKQLTQTPTVKSQGKAIYANSHALIVGIDRYSKLPASVQLSYAKKDAIALKEVLVSSYGFPEANVRLLLDDQATLAGIRDAMADFADTKKVGQDDRILVYFSGHGQTVQTVGGGEMGYLIPSDANVDLNDPSNSAAYLRSCLPMQEVWQYLKASPAKHGLIIADACFSGLLTGSRGAITQQTADVLLRRRARQVLTGGSKGEKTVERSDLGHGIFTAKLIDELKARSNQPGAAFTVSDLYASLYSSVSSATDGKQNPRLGNFEEEGEVLFAPGNKFTTILGAATTPQPNRNEPATNPPAKNNPPKDPPKNNPPKDPPKNDPPKHDPPKSGNRKEFPRIAVLPIYNIAGEKWEELKEKEVKKGHEYLQTEFDKRNFEIVGQELVLKTLQSMKVDLTDEEQQRRSLLMDIGKKLDADYLIFAIITETSQKKQMRSLFMDTEGQTTVKLWLLDLNEEKPIISAKSFVGRSGGRMTIDNKGSDRQIQATANAIRDALKDFLSKYPQVKK
jgi:hypothetical protein